MPPLCQHNYSLLLFILPTFSFGGHGHCSVHVGSLRHVLVVLGFDGDDLHDEGIARVLDGPHSMLMSRVYHTLVIYLLNSKMITITL